MAAKAAPTKKPAAKTAVAKAAATKAVAAKTAPAAEKKSSASTTAAKKAAATAAAAKTAAKKTASQTASAKTTAAKTAAAKKAAAKAADEKASALAKEADAKDAPATEAAPSADATAPEPTLAPAPEPAKRKPRPKARPKAAADDAAPTLDAVTAPEEPEPAEAVEALIAEVAEVAEADPATAAVVIRGLVKDFGDHRAVNGIDLTIPTACFYGIVGPNGAGKTTTLSILAGLLRADAGQVVVCGIDQAKDSLGAKRVMGVLPDRLRTFDRLTGRQLLHYYGLLRGLSADVIEKRAADLVRAFDLSDAVGRVVSDYSAGMTKKIMLAGAMIHSPRVLVLDEPFEAVDPVSSAVILDILRAYVAHGGTVILSSHGMDLVERVCSRVAIIVGGDVLAEGTIEDVRAGQTLESRFVELSGGISEVEGLEWLHTFSD